MIKIRFIEKLSLISIFMILICGQTHAGEKQKYLESKEIRDNIFDSAFIAEKQNILVGDRGQIFLSKDDSQTWMKIPSGTSERLFSVSFPDSKNGWISSRSGIILHTKDGGNTWVKQKSGTDKDLFSIYFSDPIHGCAVGDWGAIVVTDDGGQNWKDVHLSEDVVLYSVRMTKTCGVIVGEYGRIFRSTDQGQTWIKVPSIAEQSLFCLSEHDGKFIAGGLEGGYRLFT